MGVLGTNVYQFYMVASHCWICWFTDGNKESCRQMEKYGFWDITSALQIHPLAIPGAF